MADIKFFTSIYYGPQAKTFSEKALEKVDNYFHITGKKAVVIPGRSLEGKERVILSNSKFSASTLLKTIAIALSVFTVIIPLFMLICKAALRSAHNYQLIDPKKELEAGIDIDHKPIDKKKEAEKQIPIAENIDKKKDPEKDIQIPENKAVEVELAKGIDIHQAIGKIQALMPKILKDEDDDAVEYLKGSKVFKLKDLPNYVFKMGVSSDNAKTLHKGKFIDDKEIMEDRYENMIKAKEVCLVNNLALLIIPHAKKFTLDINDGRKCVIIAEECMDINHEESAQEEFYHVYSKELNETARQLAIFVAKTGFNDVSWRNIPLINEAKDYKGPRRVALIDLEHMESIVNGFNGDGNGSCGLIRCVSEEQLDIVIEEARKHGININKDKKERRLEEIESYKKLQLYYEDKGIVTGKEPIQVDIDALGLNLAEQGEIRAYVEDEDGKVKWEKQIVTLRKATEDVVKEINSLIQQKSDHESTKGKRHIVLSTNEDPFSRYNNLGGHADKFFLNEEEAKMLWLNQIIQALIDKGHIFKLEKVNGYGYFIQA